MPTCTAASRATESKRENILENNPSLGLDSLKELKEAYQRALLHQDHTKENDTKMKNTTASINHSRKFNPHTKATEKETQIKTNFNYYGISNISKEEADYLLWLLE